MTPHSYSGAQSIVPTPDSGDSQYMTEVPSQRPSNVSLPQAPLTGGAVVSGELVSGTNVSTTTSATSRPGAIAGAESEPQAQRSPREITDTADKRRLMGSTSKSWAGCQARRLQRVPSTVDPRIGERGPQGVRCLTAFGSETSIASLTEGAEERITLSGEIRPRFCASPHGAVAILMEACRAVPDGLGP